LPVACVPLWQVTQAPLAWEWSKWMVFQLAVTWQSPQAAEVCRWFAGLPVARRPLWQLEQGPLA